MSSQLLKRYSDKCTTLNIKPTTQYVLVSITEQRLFLIKNQETSYYDISTSHNPPSCQQDSGGTPNGLHRIAAKIGENTPIDTVFKGRVSLEKTYHKLDQTEQAKNLITSRILWLEGLEPGLNQGEGCDSYQRYIYIHGTNHEDKIGTPASGGCVQLRNREMIELYDILQTDDHVLIY
tara:strand:- start:631 stop:1164 length:534 start_codon:yes stop_codon:yes gene_type:complete